MSKKTLTYLDVPWRDVLLQKGSITAEDILELKDCSHDVSSLNEFTIKELKADTENAYVVKMTPAQRARASEHGLGNRITVHLDGIERDGTMHFHTPSQTDKNKTYNQTIEFLDYEPSLDLLRTKDATSRQFASLVVYGDVKVFCSCVAEGSWVKTFHGFKKIEDIERGDYVLSSDGNFYYVWELRCSPPEDAQNKTYRKFKTIDSDIELETSGDHEINTLGFRRECACGCGEPTAFVYMKKVLKRSIDNPMYDFSMKHAGEMTKLPREPFNHLIKRKASEILPGEYLTSVYPFCGEKEKKVSVGLGEARALGYFYGAGWMFNDENKVCITIYRTSVDCCIKDIVDTFQDVSDVAIHVSPYGRGYKDVVFSSESFKRLCHEYVNPQKDSKRLNPEVYLWPEEEKEEFLFGNFLATGTGNVSVGKLLVKTIQDALELQMLLCSIKVPTKLLNAQNSYGDSIYTLGVPLHRFTRCRERTPYVPKRSVKLQKKGTKNDSRFIKGEEEQNIILHKITQISESEGAGKRYFDICLSDGPHNYMVNGYCVSNCPAYLYWGWQYIDWQLGAGVHPEDRFPKIRNPELKGAICKHLWQVLSVLPVYQTKIMSSAKKYYPSLFKTTKTADGENLIAKLLDPAEKSLSGIALRDATLVKEKIKNKDLSKSDFSKTNFDGCDLSGCDLSGSSLKECSFVGSNLSGVNLTGADISGADFTNADVSDALFVSADAEGTDFTKCDISASQILSLKDWLAAKLTNAQKQVAEELEAAEAKQKLDVLVSTNSDLSGLTAPDADFSDSDISKKVFAGSNLVDGDFSDADCSNCHFDGSLLKGADFSGADLSNSTFDGCDLTDANFSDTTCEGASFTEADISGANFEDSDITAEQISVAINYSKAKGLSPKVKFDAKKLSMAKVSAETAKATGNLKHRIDGGEKKFKGVTAIGYDVRYTKADDLDFTDCDLHRCNFSESELKSAKFNNCDLEAALFRYCDLRKSVFKKSKLVSVDFTGSDVKDVDFTGSDLLFCNFRDTNVKAEQLIETKHWESAKQLPAGVMDRLRELKQKGEGIEDKQIGNPAKKIKDASNSDSNDVVVTDNDFSHKNLRGQKFEGAKLDRCDFSSSNLSEANFEDASVKDGVFKKTDLKGVNFQNANLQNADFSGADLSGAVFDGADIRFAKFYKSNITAVQLVSAKNWKTCRNVDKAIMTDAMMLDAQK